MQTHKHTKRDKSGNTIRQKQLDKYVACENKLILPELSQDSTFNWNSQMKKFLWFREFRQKPYFG